MSRTSAATLPEPLIERPLRAGQVHDIESFLIWEAGKEEKYELLEGVIHMNPSPERDHQTVATLLIQRIMNFVDQGLGGIAFQNYDCRINPKVYVCPDVSYDSQEKWERMKRMTPMKRGKEVIPDLAIEIVSPTYRSYDLIEKKAVYEAKGVGEYWVVDLEEDRFHFFFRSGEKFEEHTPEGTTFTTSKVLPGFVLDLPSFWKAVRF